VEIINKKYNEKMKLKNMSKKNQQWGVIYFAKEPSKKWCEKVCKR
jgi:hypothetical protein